jgi:hypothetical protein
VGQATLKDGGMSEDDNGDLRVIRRLVIQSRAVAFGVQFFSGPRDLRAPTGAFVVQRPRCSRRISVWHALYGCWNLWDGLPLPLGSCWWLAPPDTYLTDPMWRLAA